MPKIYPVKFIDEKPSFEKTIPEILSEIKPGGALQILDADEYITEQQRKWWKGVLLKHLSRDTGDSEHWWETHLKRAVMPDKFLPIPIASKRKIVYYVPSITILSKKQMNEMIEGSIAELRDETKYGDQFLSYTLPDKTKRADWNMKVKDENRHLTEKDLSCYG